MSKDAGERARYMRRVHELFEHYAAAALQGILASSEPLTDVDTARVVADSATDFALAMVERHMRAVGHLEAILAKAEPSALPSPPTPTNGNGHAPKP